MTETDKNKLPIQTQRIVNGINLMFAGIGEILSAMEPDMAKAVQALAKAVPAAEDLDPNTFEEIIPAEDVPSDTEPEEKPKEQPKKKAPAKKQEPASELTADDLIKVVTGKIKQNRANKDKVLTLLKSYGAAKVSDIPADKYEAFITDLSQL